MTATDTELQKRLRDLSRADAARLAGRTAVPVSTSRAWRELRARHERSAALRRRGRLIAAVAVVVAVVIAVPVLSRTLASSLGPQPSGSGPAAPRPPRTYPSAISARIPISGVVAMTADGTHAYLIRHVGVTGLTGTYQLAGIDLKTNSVTFAIGLGRQEPGMAAGPASCGGRQRSASRALRSLP